MPMAPRASLIVGPFLRDLSRPKKLDSPENLRKRLQVREQRSSELELGQPPPRVLETTSALQSKTKRLQKASAANDAFAGTWQNLVVAWKLQELSRLVTSSST